LTNNLHYHTAKWDQLFLLNY